jgi:hypothetical protein
MPSANCARCTIYVAQNSTRYAQGLVDRITRRTQQLSTMPYLAAIVPEYEEENDKGIGGAIVSHHLSGTGRVCGDLIGGAWRP